MVRKNTIINANMEEEISESDDEKQEEKVLEQ